MQRNQKEQIVKSSGLFGWWWGDILAGAASLGPSLIKSLEGAIVFWWEINSNQTNFELRII